MEDGILNFNGKQIGLRGLGNNTFEPKNNSVFENALSNKPVVDSSNNLSVLLLVKSNDGLIDKLNSIEAEMEGKNWAFWIGDTTSGDRVSMILDHHQVYSSSSVFAPLKLSESFEEALTFDYLRKLSAQYNNIFKSEISYIHGENQLDKKHELKSFCFVCTKELMKEGAIFIESVRLFYDQPIYIICDLETKSYFDSFDFKNLIFKLDAEGEILKEIKSKHFETLYSEIKSPHRVECIFQKMAAMNFALSEQDNTFFLDSDIVLVNKIDENLNRSLILSPHYHGVKNINNSLRFGFFNAGYVFCAEKNFPDYWKDLYLTRSKFYEQECMNYIAENYDIGIFDKNHNWGFWRSEFKIPCSIRSFHLHLTNGIYGSDCTALSKLNEQIKMTFYRYLDLNSKFENMKILQDKIKLILK